MATTPIKPNTIAPSMMDVLSLFRQRLRQANLINMRAPFQPTGDR
ncbi:hypothetical protein D049_1424 [Vibrio parahaemolyticus VPTS-2010]|nr:hypothetical protein D049_1424 [Vibrio parahaemolyticus VPTS-2010]